MEEAKQNQESTPEVDKELILTNPATAEYLKEYLELIDGAIKGKGEQSKDKMTRLKSRITNYLILNRRTWDQEYALIKEKKSELPARERDYIVFAYEFSLANTQTKTEEV
jgi:hypothetical protein